MKVRTIDVVVGGTVVLFFASVLAGQSPIDSPTEKGSSVATKKDVRTVLTVEAARGRAKLMHSIYAATLDMIHHRYFRRDRATVPARAMEDVFSEIDRQANIKSSWIAVHGNAMSIDHEPEGAFELAAVKAIASGKEFFEQASDDTYRRVGAIPLTGGCMTCHGSFGSISTSKRFVGLVIEIPLKHIEASLGK